MSFGSRSFGAIAVCLAVGVSFAAASVECDAERGICRKRVDGKIERSVRDIAGGIVAEITSNDTETALRIGRHLADVTERFERGQSVPASDPFFSALAAHRGEVALSITEIEGGVRVSATSRNPEVVALIRQHAAKGVSEFADKGLERAPQRAPRPASESAP